MALKHSLLALMIVSHGVAAEGWVQDWYNNTYQQEIAPQQQQQIEQQQLSECDSKVGYYLDKYRAEPNSIYYKIQLDRWKKKCNR